MRNSHTAKLSWQTKLIWYWGPVILYCGLIVYLSSQSAPSQYIPPFLYGMSDKLLHGIEFGILGILFYRAFRENTPKMRSIALAVFCTLVFGMSDEFHQWFVPGRSADVWDLMADTLGATTLICGWAFIMEKRSFSLGLQQTRSK